MIARATAVALVTVAVLGSPAHARPREGTVAVLALEISGDGEPMLRQQLLRSLAGGLAAGGLRVVDFDAVRAALDETPELVGCTSTTCLSRIGARVGANYFVRAQVEANGSAYELALELLSADVEGALVMRLEHACAVCTIMEVNDLMSATARRLVELPPARPMPVLIETEPSGARISIDERAVGVSPYRGQLGAGEHGVAATLDGHERAETTIAVSENPGKEPQAYSIALVAAPRDGATTWSDDVATPARPYRLWKWAAAGGAAAALIGGISLVALDGSGACGLEAPQTQCEQLYDTGVAGALAIVAGVGLGATGGWMFYRDHHAARAAQLTVAPTRGGALAHLQLRF